MSESNRKKIKLLGFEPVQKAIVASLATLSRSRSIQYHITDEDDIFQSNVLLIDVHDEVVIENWRQLKEIVGDLPVVAIGEQSVAGATVWVKRSQIATTLLDTLDELLVDTAKPESTTSQSSSPDASAQHPDTGSAGPSLAEPSTTETPSVEAAPTPQQEAPKKTSWFRPSAKPAPAADSSDQAKPADTASDSSSKSSDSAKGVLFVTPDAKPSTDGLGSVAQKQERSLPYAFGKKPGQSTPAPVEQSTEAKSAGDDKASTEKPATDKTPVDSGTAQDANASAAAKRLNEAKNELKRDNAADSAPVSEKERLDNELSSVIKQIRESSANGEGGVIVDNEGPDAQQDNPFIDPTREMPAAPAPQTTAKKGLLPQTTSPGFGDTAQAKAPGIGQQQQTAASGTGAWPKNIVSPENSKHKNRFLICDDSSYVWTQLRICLENCPADLDFVSTAEDSLEEVKKRPYDLVFMDVMLPGMNGYDACKKIKKDKQSKHVPVIMLTGRSAPANKLKGVLSGCNYYMTKPVAEAEVRAVVDRFFTRVLKKSA